MSDLAVARVATGAACAIFDGHGRVLLVRHTYGRRNWELPGGVGEAGESPEETASRELLEETSLRAELQHLTGVYYEPNHDFGSMLHFVFRARWHAGLDPIASSPEIGEIGYWSVNALPTPISDFTERRIRDAARPAQNARVVRVETRHWRE
jgi:8-oxo-dGTP diphosphatase